MKHESMLLLDCEKARKNENYVCTLSLLRRSTNLNQRINASTSFFAFTDTDWTIDSAEIEGKPKGLFMIF